MQSDTLSTRSATASGLHFKLDSRKDGPLSQGYFRRNVPRAKAIPSVQKIVRLTQQANVPCVGRTKPSKGLDVIELEKRPASAAPTIR